jgi:hypothetical protein
MRGWPRKGRQWWRLFGQKIDGLFTPKIPMIWLLDTNATVGSEQSSAIGPRQAQK